MDLTTKQHPIEVLSRILAQTEARMSLHPVVIIPFESLPKDFGNKYFDFKESIFFDLWYSDIICNVNTIHAEPLKNHEPEPLINIEL